MCSSLVWPDNSTPRTRLYGFVSPIASGLRRSPLVSAAARSGGRKASAMHDQAGIRSLPIDIAFGRLQEWLVDRKRVPQDWRKRLAGIRARLAAAFASLPRDLDPSLLALEPDGKTPASPLPKPPPFLLRALLLSQCRFGRIGGYRALPL